MTEAEWLSCSHPLPMLEFLEERASDRKYLLFTIQVFDDYCRYQYGWSAFHHPARPVFFEDFVRFLQKIADGDVEPSVIELELQKWKNSPHEDVGACAAEAAELLFPISEKTACHRSIDVFRFLFSKRVDFLEREYRSTDDVNAAARQLAHHYVELVREIFGNPLQPLEFDRRWLHEDYAREAEMAYESQDYSMLEEVGDSLTWYGGADSNPIIAHLRSNSRHAPGCWALDILLEKEKTLREFVWGDRCAR